MAHQPRFSIGEMMKTFLAVLLLVAATPAMATQYLTDFESVPPSQDHQVLGGAGAIGDELDQLVINVTTSATGTVAISDGASTLGPDYVIAPANTPVGVYSITLKARSKLGGWRVRTGAGASVFAVGSFR